MIGLSTIVPTVRSRLRYGDWVEVANTVFGLVDGFITDLAQVLVVDGDRVAVKLAGTGREKWVPLLSVELLRFGPLRVRHNEPPHVRLCSESQ